MAGCVDKIYAVFRPLKSNGSRRDSNAPCTLFGEIVGYGGAIVDLYSISLDGGVYAPPGLGI